MRKMVVFVEYAKQKAAEKNGGVNKLPTKYVLGGGNLTLFDATTGKELSNIDNVRLDSCKVEKGTQSGNWMRKNASFTIDGTVEFVK